MDWYRSNCGFRYTGFYLAPAPSHQNTSWMNRREYLAAQAWGLPCCTAEASAHVEVARGRSSDDDDGDLEAF